MGYKDGNKICHAAKAADKLLLKFIIFILYSFAIALLFDVILSQ